MDEIINEFNKYSIDGSILGSYFCNQVPCRYCPFYQDTFKSFCNGNVKFEEYVESRL